MKRFTTVLFAVLLLGFSSLSNAAEVVRFGWSYSAEEQAKILGFKLYEDGVPFAQVAIPPEARTVTIPRRMDKQPHAYYLTAYSADDESKPSAIVIDNYIKQTVAKVDGVLTIEIINQ